MFTLFTKSLCFALIGIGILCIALTAWYCVECVKSHNQIELDYYEVISKTSSTDILAEFNDFIFSIFENYTRLNIGVYNQYIDVTPEQEVQISKDVSELVIVCMSKDLRNKIAMVIEDEMINEMITKQVYVFTTTFVLESRMKK